MRQQQNPAASHAVNTPLGSVAFNAYVGAWDIPCNCQRKRLGCGRKVSAARHKSDNVFGSRDVLEAKDVPRLQVEPLLPAQLCSEWAAAIHRNGTRIAARHGIDRARAKFGIKIRIAGGPCGGHQKSICNVCLCVHLGHLSGCGAGRRQSQGLQWLRPHSAGKLSRCMLIKVIIKN